MPPKRRVRRKQGNGIRDFFKELKTGYQSVEKVGQVRNQYENALKKNSAPPLPPKPKHQQAPKKVNPLGVVETIRKYKPIGTIDNVLKDLGVRDRVRSKLNSHSLGKHLVSAADTAISQGFGKKKVTKKRYSGSKSHRMVRF